MTPKLLWWTPVLVLAGCALPGTGTSASDSVNPHDRYSAVALSCEYSQCPTGVVKPRGPIGIDIKTATTSDQSEAIAHTIEQWNDACPEHPLSLGPSDATMEIYFVDKNDMAAVLPIYVEGNVGLFTYDWDAQNVITGSVVAIANELTGRELTHFVLEETTQAMGLINDVDDSSSIFDGGSGRVTEYSEIDMATIAIHCDPQTLPGMTAEEIP